MKPKRHLLSVSEASGTEHLGVKGKNLITLHHCGFRIPRTLFLTTLAFDLFMKAGHLKEEIKEIEADDSADRDQQYSRICDVVRSSALPSAIMEEIAENHLLRDDHRFWAVRSSSNMEDLKGRSFAGLYDTCLDVQGIDRVVESIKKCWCSLWSARAVSYRRKNLLDESRCKMAVVIQEMVKAEISGVVFTRDPVHPGSRDMVVEYCRGNGEKIVSGAVTPCSLMMDRRSKSVSPVRGMQGIEAFHPIRMALSETCLQIEAMFGCPQDIEWAFDGRSVYILQTRPVSFAGKFAKGSPTRVWTRANIGEILPGVVTPLTWDVFRMLMKPKRSGGKSSQNSESVHGKIRLVRGRGYIRLDCFLDTFCYLPQVTPETLSAGLGVQFLPHLHSYERPKGFMVLLARCCFMMDSLGLWGRASRIARRLAPPPAPGSSPVAGILSWLGRCFRVHLLCTGYAIGNFALLKLLLDRWLPSGSELLLPLLLRGKADFQTAAQGASLWELAQFVGKKGELRSVIEERLRWSDLLRKLPEIDGGNQFRSRLERFLESNGARAAGEFELSVPRWREDPSFILDVVRRFLVAAGPEGKNTVSGASEEDLRQALHEVNGSLNFLQRRIFSRFLASYRKCTSLRENMKYLLMEGFANLRRTLLEIGGDLKQKGCLAHREDIFFLTLREIERLAERGKSRVRPMDRIRRRKEQRSRCLREDAPFLIPPEGGRDLSSGEGALRGIGCSPGFAKGRARILHHVDEFSTFQPGEILVTHYTDPGWTPIFLTCRAVVTEIGGFLSHGATVAREYGVPAVVNVADATRRIRTGDLIRVDGSRGDIFIDQERATGLCG